MTHGSLDDQQLFSALIDEGAQVITASQRQKRSLLQRLSQYQKTEGQEVWLSPKVATLGEFLKTWVDGLLFSGRLPEPLASASILSTRQEEFVWQQVIEQCERDSVLLNRSGLASLAQQAAALQGEWFVQVRPGAETIEYTHYCRWRDAMVQRLGKDWLSNTEWKAALVRAVPHLADTLPRSLLLLGFEDISPLDQSLFDAWRKAGLLVQRAGANSSSEVSVSRVACTDVEQECYAAAHWSLQQRGLNARKIAVVVPQLTELRAQVEVVFERLLHPEVRYRASQTGRDFNISLGEPLLDVTLIQDAVRLLEIVLQPSAVKQPDLWHLLRSPYWSASLQEQEGRARLEARLRQKSLTISFASFAALVREGNDVPVLCQHVAALVRWRADSYQMKGIRPAAHWADFFIKVLNEGGWPGQRVLDSCEHQALAAFRQVLMQLGQIESVGGTLDLMGALAELRLLLSRQLFQPETEGHPRVQILGLLEAIGGEFDALWVMGLTDDVFPAIPKPNPLLPPAAQRMAQVPHASAERELHFARGILKQLLESSAEIIFSYAERDGDRELNPSPLILAFQEAPKTSMAGASFKPAIMERIIDQKGPPVAEEELLKGGNHLLKAQAICPLWAFVQYRLHAKALVIPEDGLPRQKIGNLVHVALEFFWRETRTHQRLCQLVESNELAAVVQQAVENAFVESLSKEETPKPMQLQLYKQQVSQWVIRWLTDFEKGRAPFEVVELEAAHTAQLGKLKIGVRGDRVDRYLKTGGKIVIDYKTGKADICRSWTQDRISEPQVPLYCVSMRLRGDHEVSGAVLAGLKQDKGQMEGFKGVTQLPDMVTGVNSLQQELESSRSPFDASRHQDWKQLLNTWEASLMDIAGEIVSGEAAMRVRSIKDLEYCPVRPVLRLPEYAHRRGDDQEEAAL